MYKFILKNKVLIIIATLLVIYPVVYPSPYILHLMILVGIFSMIALGVGALIGFGGQISVGHAAFFGCGAYTSAILTTTYNFPVWPSLIISVVLTAAMAFLIGRPIVKLRGYFLALATLAFQIIMSTIFLEARAITNGYAGISNIPWLNIGSFQFDTYFKIFYLVWIILFLLYLFLNNILKGKKGIALRTLATSEPVAESVGINVPRLKLNIFVLSAIYAAIAGSLYAHFISAICPPIFTVELSLLFIIMVLLGGAGSAPGMILGAAFVTLVTRFLSAYQEYSMLVWGAGIIILLNFMPNGIYPKIEATLRRLKGV